MAAAAITESAAALQGFVDWKGNPVSKGRHGGYRAAVFIYVMVVLTNMAYVPNVMNTVTYLHDYMHTDVASSSTTITNFIGATCAFSLLGAFLSDSYITRYKTILMFGPFEFLGFGLLALQAHFPSLQPPKCDMSGQSSTCERVHGYHAALLYAGLFCIALGEGCLRSALASFGGDQFDDNDTLERQKKSSFFNWFTFGISLGVFGGLTLVVWVENKKGWDYGFALCAFLIFVGLLIVASGFSFYRNLRPRGSPLTRILQVFVVAFKKRKLSLPDDIDALWKEHGEDIKAMEVLPHTKDFRFLDKASIYHGSSGSWSLCTVTQVEEAKIIIKMLPLFISAVFTYIPIPLVMTLTIQQGSTMNTSLGKIYIAPASLFIIPVIFQMLILVVYDRIFVPFARRITGYASGITHLQRVGAGCVSIILASCVAAVIEMKRRKLAGDNASGTTVPMSVFWLGIQFFVVGITDVTSFVGLLEFFNSEVSRGMKSIGTAIFWCILGLASFLGSLLVDVVNKATRYDGNIGWLDGKNLNKSRLDYFYWFLAVVGSIAFLNYLYWAKRYGYRQNPRVALAY